MKKIYYFRAMLNKKDFTFKKCEGYAINFYNGSSAVDLVFGKDDFNKWTITELSSGYLAHNGKFSTRKEAIAAITPEYLKAIINKISSWQWFEEAQKRLTKYKSTLED